MRRCLVLSLLTLAALLALAGSALGAARLYMPSYGIHEPEQIGGFERAPNGSLSPIPGSPFAAYSFPSPPVAGLIDFAFAPQGDRAAASFLSGGGVQGYSVSTGGAISPTNAVTSLQSEEVAVSPDGRFVYEATREYPFGSGTEGIKAFSLGANGELSPTGIPNEPTETFGEVALSPNGRFAFGLVIGGLYRFAVNPDGSLTTLGMDSIDARWLTTSPDGRFLFVGAEGGTGRVTSYAIGSDGSLTQRGEPVLTGSSAEGQFAVSPDGRHLYIPDKSSDEVVVAAVAADGSPSTIGSVSAEGAEVTAVSPDGKFLYVYSESGSAGGIGAYSIGADGMPTKLPFAPTVWPSGEPVRMVFQPAATPIASFTAQPGVPGQVTTFDAGASIRAAHYSWDFGDGTSLADGGPTPSHVYAKPGAYTASLSVTDAQGCGTAQIYTGQSTACPGGSAAKATTKIETLPVLSQLRSTNKKFFPKGKAPKGTKAKVGTSFAYELDESAGVAIGIERKLSGRVVGGACKKRTPSNAKRKKCTLFKTVGTLSAAGTTGQNNTKFSGKPNGRPLAPGSYLARAVATDSSGGLSAPQTAAFKVLGG